MLTCVCCSCCVELCLGCAHGPRREILAVPHTGARHNRIEPAGTADDRQYLVIVQKLWLNESGQGVAYTAYGEPAADRERAFDAAVDHLGHDDLNIATIQGGRVVAFGDRSDDFGPDEDGAPHYGHNLGEIALQIGLS